MLSVLSWKKVSVVAFFGAILFLASFLVTGKTHANARGDLACRCT